MFLSQRLGGIFLLMGWAWTAFLLPAQEIIPSERRIQWDPGIPGGIPAVTGPEISVLDHGADPTGGADSHAAFSSAIEAVPSTGGVVLIPEGTYLLGSPLEISKSGVILRGSGRNTRIYSEAAGSSIDIYLYERGDWQVLPAELAKGDSLMKVADGSLFTIGQFVEITRENDPELMYTNDTWNVSWAERSVGQLFEISGISGDTLELDRAAFFDYPLSLQPEARPMNLVRDVGLEDFYIEKTTASGHTVDLKNTAYCWISNMESYHTRKYHVAQSTCLGNEIRDSYFHRSFDYGDGGSGYGVECGLHCTSVLVENNIFDSLRHAMMVHLGASGNVFAYNYSINPLQGSGETLLNLGWDPPDVSIHGHYPLMNLIESNDLEEIGIGDYWGPAGPGNTYFRNRVRGDEGIIYYDASHQQNLVGNISGKIRDLTGIAGEALEHGNVVGGQVAWDPEISNHELSHSYYLDEAPGFFASMAWPPFGPEVSEGSELPAQVRYDFLLSTHSGNFHGAGGESSIRIWPNPCKGLLHLSGVEAGAQLRLLDISGRPVLLLTGSPETIDLGTLERGIYLLESTSPSGRRIVERLICQ